VIGLSSCVSQRPTFYPSSSLCKLADSYLGATVTPKYAFSPAVLIIVMWCILSGVFYLTNFSIYPLSLWYNIEILHSICGYNMCRHMWMLHGSSYLCLKLFGVSLKSLLKYLVDHGLLGCDAILSCE
jgi:hypothetical protein